MKKLTILFVLTLLISCAGRNTDNEKLIASNPYLIGKWTGKGKFLDRNTRKKFGKVKIEVEIKEDNTILGKIGDAQIINTSIAKARYGFEIKGKLDSKLKNDISFKRKKDHLIILLVLPKKNRKNVTTSDANFHLKSNYIFDLYMEVGGVDLVKEL